MIELSLVLKNIARDFTLAQVGPGAAVALVARPEQQTGSAVHKVQVEGHARHEWYR